MPPAFVHTGRQLGRGVPVINRAHPLAQNLLAAYVPAAFPGGRISNLAAPGYGDITTRTGNAVGLGLTTEGPGLSYFNTTASNATGLTPTSWQLNYGVSLFLRGRLTTAGTNGAPVTLFGVTLSTSPFNAYAIGQGGTVGNVMSLFQTSSAANQNGTIVPTVGAMLSVGATFPRSTIPNLYVNGVQDTINNAVTVNITYAGTVSTTLGGAASGRNVGITFTVCYIWNRVLTAAENRYLDANPYALLLWPSDRVSMALATLASGGTTIRAEAILAAEFLESLLSDSGVRVELLAGGSTITGNAMLPLEFSATVLRNWGAGAAQSIIRRFSRTALIGRVRRLFFPGHQGTLAIESEGQQHADPGAPIESLGSAGNSVAGDAMSPIETLSSQRSEQGAAIENTESLQVDPATPAEALAASLLNIRGPVEALAGGITTITDANLAIEWVMAAPPILISLESGRERVRLLATRGRVRLLRRK